MDLALLVLRAVIGAFFIGHGAQKLFGAFGGHGPAGTAAFFESLGMRPGRLQALAAGWGELLGGALLLLGLFTPVASLLIIAVMVVAIITVHASNGPWVTNSGYEYNAVLIAAAFALAGAGPGEFSLDSAFGLELASTTWAIGAAALGLLGAIGAVLFARAGRRAPGRATSVSARHSGGRFARPQVGGATPAAEPEIGAATAVPDRPTPLEP